MLDLEQCRTLASGRAAQLAEGGEIDPVPMCEPPHGVVFDWSDPASRAARARGILLVGGGPLLVDRATGAVHRLSSGLPAEEALDNLLRFGDPYIHPGRRVALSGPAPAADAPGGPDRLGAVRLLRRALGLHPAEAKRRVDDALAGRETLLEPPQAADPAELAAALGALGFHARQLGHSAGPRSGLGTAEEEAAGRTPAATTGGQQGREVKMRDHGGNLDGAMAAHGGAAADWLDLSTGINPHAWPVPDLPLRAWTALPTRADMAALEDAAQAAYGTGAACVPLAGASGAIQMVPLLAAPGVARVLGPTYNEHAAALRAAGWRVEEVRDPAALAGADLAVIVNPNNPDGRAHAPASLRALAGQVGLLVVDESFVDIAPELSLAPGLEEGPPNLLVLRSFGKFYGLAGLRLGFALAPPPLADKLREMAGPWPVSGAAVEIGRRALRDRVWAAEMRARLAAQAALLDRNAAAAGWRLVGGTSLFRTWETPDAAAAQDALARARIWSRIFPYSPTWLRLGLPPEDGRTRLAAALAGMG